MASNSSIEDTQFVPMRFMLVLVVVTFLVSTVRAENPLPPVTPYKPILRTKIDVELCDAFQSAWMKAFLGPTNLDAQWVDFQEAIPEADFFTFPPQPKRDGGFSGVYGVYRHALDFDGDGNQEILYIQSNAVGSRYYGASVCLFETEEDYLVAKTISDRERPSRYIYFGLLEDQLDPAPTFLISFPPVSVVFLFSLNGAIYATASPQMVDVNGPLSAKLTQLNGGNGPQDACVVDLLPSSETVWNFVDTSELLKAVNALYGGEAGPRCQSTSAAVAPRLEDILLTLFHRPQAMISAHGYPIPESESENAAREIRLQVWGLSDPMSWSDYMRIKRSWLEFVRPLKKYYLRYFTTTDSEAQALAEHAYRFLIDRIVYARSTDSSRLTKVAMNSQDAWNIGAESSPRDIAKIAIDRWLQLTAPRKSNPVYGREEIWHDAILAALYTRQDADQIRALWERLEAVLELRMAKFDTKEGRAQFGSKRSAFLGDMLVAALGDHTLSGLILSFGADVNAPTNWFNKTPLMYAAQLDDLEAVQFLLANGANPSSQTSAADEWCRGLNRDARTPLMYAAENASPQLIAVLLEAGADVAAADTQGNTTVWYLDRNERLSESDRTQIRKLIQTVQ